MKQWGLVAALMLVGCGAGDGEPLSRTESPSPALEVVQEQMEAFNRHDEEAMAGQVAPDFVWLSVGDDEVSVEARGSAALAEGMRSYFASLPDVRSEIEESVVSGAFVAVRERVEWTDAGGVARSQAALGVYEVRNGLIQRVWYFPAER